MCEYVIYAYNSKDIDFFKFFRWISSITTLSVHIGQ